MTKSNSTSNAGKASACEINAIVKALRDLRIRSPLDDKVTVALDQALGNHETGARKLILAIIGPSGVGKSTTVDRLLSHDRFEGRVISVTATSPASVKSVARDVLHAMGHPLTRSQIDDNDSIMHLKRGIALTGTLIIHVDEAQHLLTSKGDVTTTRTLDNLKLIVQKPNPVVLILTGTDRVANVFSNDDQLFERTIFVEAAGLSVDKDSRRTAKLLAKLCARAGLEKGWTDADQLPQRITLAGRNFGLSVSLIIDAIELELRAGRKVLNRESFAKVYARDRDVGGYLNPFVAQDFMAIDPSRRTDVREEDRDVLPVQKRRGRKKKGASS